MNANCQYACFAFGEGKSLLAILLTDEQYVALHTLPGFFYFCRRCLKLCDKDVTNSPKEKASIALDVIRTSATSTSRSTTPNGWLMSFFYIADVSFTDSSTSLFTQPKLAEVNLAVLINRLCVRHGVNVPFVVNFCARSKSSKTIDVGGTNALSWRETLDLSEHQCFLQVPADPEEVKQENDDWSRSISVDRSLAGKVGMLIWVNKPYERTRTTTSMKRMTNPIIPHY